MLMLSKKQHIWKRYSILLLAFLCMLVVPDGRILFCDFLWNGTYCANIGSSFCICYAGFSSQMSQDASQKNLENQVDRSSDAKCTIEALSLSKEGRGAIDPTTMFQALRSKF